MIADTDGQIETVEIRVDKDNHLRIKLILYRTPLHKPKLVQGAIGSMLETVIIERSTSLWRALIKIINPLTYPITMIDDILALLGKLTYFPPLIWGLATGKYTSTKPIERRLNWVVPVQYYALEIGQCIWNLSAGHAYSASDTRYEGLVAIRTHYPNRCVEICHSDNYQIKLDN